jgi:hypothetical protein
MQWMTVLESNNLGTTFHKWEGQKKFVTRLGARFPWQLSRIFTSSGNFLQCFASKKPSSSHCLQTLEIAFLGFDQANKK